MYAQADIGLEGVNPKSVLSPDKAFFFQKCRQRTNCSSIYGSQGILSLIKGYPSRNIGDAEGSLSPRLASTNPPTLCLIDICEILKKIMSQRLSCLNTRI